MTAKYRCPYCGQHHPAHDLVACKRPCRTCNQPPIDWSQVGIYDALVKVLEARGIDNHELAGALTVATYEEMGLL